MQGPPAAARASPEQLAVLAQHLGLKLERLAADTDPEQWRRLDFEPTGADAAASSRAAMLRRFVAHIGGLPALASLLQPAARLALLPREDIRSRLCALALAGRPGVLRCCVDKATRQALQQSLGPAWTPLCAISRRGSNAGPAPAPRSPLEWACVGYADWRAALLPGEPVLHRLVGLSLPASLLEATLAGPAEAAEVAPQRALQQLADEGLPWPC